MLSLHQINQKIKYYGCFLFSTYMVIVRAKKSTVYEPKHWFPLRQFSLQTLQDSDGKGYTYVPFDLFLFFNIFFYYFRR